MKDRFNGTIVFAPAAIFIVFYLSNNTSFDWVLVNVTEQGGEIFDVVNGLTFETFLEEVTIATIFAIIVILVILASLW